MKELFRIKHRIEKGNLTDVYVVAKSVNSAKVLIEKLKKDTFKDLTLTYRHITNPNTSDGINYEKSAVILWDRWFESDKIINFIAKEQWLMPHIFNLSDN